MPFYLAEIIGDGSDAEGNEFRPAILDHAVDGWRCIVDGRADSTVRADHMLVECAANDDFAKDSRIVLVTQADLRAFGVPDLGKVDEREAAVLVGQRFLLRQMLKGDDYGRHDVRMDDLPTGKRDALTAKLAALKLDTAEIKGSTTVGGSLSILLPQLVVEMDAKPQSPSGTFTDAFTDDGSGTEDLAAHTPTGGAAWTRVDGSVDMAQVSGGVLRNITTDSNGAVYWCDDQGSSAQYHQAKWLANIAPFSCNRVTDRSNYIGVRISSFHKRVAGTFTQLGTAAIATNSVIRLESSSSDAHTVYDDGVAVIGPVTETFNNTQTRQGVNARNHGASDWLDDFEAGVLSTGGSGRVFALAGLGGGLVYKARGLAA